MLTKILRVQGRFLHKGPYDGRFEGLRKGARHERVIYNNCNAVKKSVLSLTEEGEEGLSNLVTLPDVRLWQPHCARVFTAFFISYIGLAGLSSATWD